MRIGEKINQLIENKGISKTDFAKIIGFTPQGLHNILQKEDVSTQIVKLIINKMGIPVAYFFTDDNELVNLPTNLPTVEVGEVQTKDLAYPDADVGKEARLLKALRRERKARELERNKYLAIIEQQAKH